MSKLTKILGTCAVLTTLGSAVLATTASSAQAFYQFPYSHGWHEHWRFHFVHREYWTHGYGWAYRVGDYRHVAEVSAPRACQPGFHLGYRGRYCWPNR